MSNKIVCEKCGNGNLTLHNKQGHYYCEKCKQKGGIQMLIATKKDQVIHDLKQENKDLRYENEELKDFKNKMINIMNNSEITKENYFITLNKIKEELAVNQTYQFKQKILYKHMISNSIIHKIELEVKQERRNMEETLENLENRYFMLQMQDHWDSSDYRYAEELREKINKLKERKTN